MLKFGFIGVGHMGATLAQAVINAVGAENVAVCGGKSGKAERFAERNGCAVTNDRGIAEKCRYIFLGVKPQTMAEVFEEIGPLLKERREPFVLVTMAAGITVDRLQKLAGLDAPVLRIMPNTPSAVGAGCTLWTGSPELSDGDREAILDALKLTGELVRMPEALMDAGSAVSGCGPAFVYEFILALKKGGEALGLAPEDALKLARQTVFGAAKLAIESGEDPEILCGQVCSPGGSTIEGVKSLEAGPFDGEVGKAVAASFRRTVELGK